MPGQRAVKQDDHREALIHNTMDSSSGVNAPRHSSVAGADAALPNTIMSGAVLNPDVQPEQPALSFETLTETGRPSRLHAPPPALPTASPSPAPARLLSPRQASHTLFPAPTSAHPLSPAPTSSAGPTSATAVVPVMAAGSAVTVAPALPGSSPRRSNSLSNHLAALPSSTSLAAPAAAVADSASCVRAPSGTGQLHAAGSGTFAPECRICLLSDPLNDLVVPCRCTGSMAYAHLGCLRTWVMEKRSVHCELCNTMYKEPYGSELAASIPPLPPQPQPVVRRLTTPDGQPIIIMPVGMGLGPNTIGPLLQHHGGGAGGAAMVAGVPDPRDLEPQPLCEWRNMWSYALILLLLLFAIIYVTVISRKGKQEPWMKTLWQVLLVVLPIYLVLRVAFDLYRHRLAQQLAAANMQAVALANAAAAADAAAAAAGQQPGRPREVIITRAGDRVLVLQRAGP